MLNQKVTMYRLSVLLLCVSALACLTQLLKKAESHFEEFIIKHKKKYSSEIEKRMRFEIFRNNLKEIIKKNSNPLESAMFGITRFSDLTQEEFRKKFTCESMSQYKPRFTSYMRNVSRPVKIDLPDSFSWVDKGAVTPIKDQEMCGSCWTFSTTGAVEGAYAIKHKSLVSFSEQQLVDCDRSDGGCFGGLPLEALKYIQNAGGLEKEHDYPYTAQDQECKFDARKAVAKVTSVNPANVQSEDDMRQLLYSTAPVSICLDASFFQLYKGGVLAHCPPGPINHAVLLVGYGSEDGVPYWLVKNSWGTTWGEKGYIKLQRGINACGFMNKYSGTVQVE